MREFFAGEVLTFCEPYHNGRGVKIVAVAGGGVNFLREF
jgi:hypothetical protein